MEDEGGKAQGRGMSKFSMPTLMLPIKMHRNHNAFDLSNKGGNIASLEGCTRTGCHSDEQTKLIASNNLIHNLLIQDNYGRDNPTLFKDRPRSMPPFSTCSHLP